MLFSCVSTHISRVLIVRKVKDMDFSKRQLDILYAIISDYIETAVPVGSRTINRKYMPEISSATIRNEMSDLEHMGLLEQPHTSAGRIPSEKAYRMYVDTIISSEEMDSLLTSHIPMTSRGNW